MQEVRKTVFITGASSGIGQALALTYAKKDFNLSLFARRAERLSKVKKECLALNPKIEVLCSTGDVTQENQLKIAVQNTHDQFARIDIVIANAGYSKTGKFEKLKIKDYRELFETNVFGVINTAILTLDFLRQSNGRLALMGSASSYLCLGGDSPYAMSKFAVRALAESLFSEFKNTGASVTLICPGFVDSEIRKTNSNNEFDPTRKDPIPAYFIMDSLQAARKIESAIRKRKREVIITNHAKAGIFLKRHFPGVFSACVKPKDHFLNSPNIS